MNNTKTIILGIIIALLLIALALVLPARAGLERSVYDGTWEITFTDCAGNVRTFEDCKIDEISEVWISFRFGGRSASVRLPVQSTCSNIIMERK